MRISIKSSPADKEIERSTAVTKKMCTEEVLMEDASIKDKLKWKGNYIVVPYVYLMIHD